MLDRKKLVTYIQNGCFLNNQIAAFRIIALTHKIAMNERFNPIGFTRIWSISQGNQVFYVGIFKRNQEMESFISYGL